MIARLLETVDVARLLGVSSERVRQLANSRRLQVSAVTVRGGRLFSENKVRRFARRRQREALTPAVRPRQARSEAGPDVC